MSAKKKPNFWNFLDNVQAGIVCECETWLPPVEDSEVLPTNRRAKRSKHYQDWLRFKALKKQAQKTCQDTHDSYTNDMLTIDNKNPKRF